MATATVKQAMEIIKMQAFGCKADLIAEYLADENIDEVIAYHVTKTENAESIRKFGIKTADCYSRIPAAYLFLDSRDVKANAPVIIGDGEYITFTVRIPAIVAATIKDDGLFNGTFTTSYSACRVEQQIPATWIME